ncbi:T9SS type A sorting domain-containing protein [uncultured Polaribacter sp.]|uniref:T9SS type A sorting domain-containing protein n=1 Tax=uncultured Polaribacter sp. TaxID=174711 RepID=UPI002627DD05|nr:T9SS type A sorting domain-containing protein [uncultured Polaribacter sp.]
MNKLLFLFVYLICHFLYGQVSNFKEKFDLPETVNETSGLLFFDGKIITHNDSGGQASLYELDSLTGNLTRTVAINNATNIDWEDITEDENHIYIADIGNNNGNRTDLAIYKILKSEFKNNTAVNSEIITFSYEDQTNFSSQPNASNFDAEAIVAYKNHLLIFTKNWQDFKTNVYKIPIEQGNHTAIKVSSANIEGLITGGVFANNRFFLTGYSSTLIPFLIFIAPNSTLDDAIFSSGFDKISLEDNLGQGSQVEAITNIQETGKYYISREKITTTIAGTSYNFNQKLYEFKDNTQSTLTLNDDFLKFVKITNPIKNNLQITTKKDIESIVIYNSLSEVVASNFGVTKINTSKLTKGIYYAKIVFKDALTMFKKIIKL